MRCYYQPFVAACPVFEHDPRQRVQEIGSIQEYDIIIFQFLSKEPQQSLVVEVEVQPEVFDGSFFRDEAFHDFLHQGGLSEAVGTGDGTAVIELPEPQHYGIKVCIDGLVGYGVCSA